MRVIVLSGFPGSGKSTYAAQFDAYNAWNNPEGTHAIICSADHYMIDDADKYHFDRAKLGMCHAACMRRFVDYITKWHAYNDILVVDNTNLSAAEISPYMLVAAAYNVPAEIHRIHCDPKVAFARQTHGVPRGNFNRMVESFNRRDVWAHWDVREIK